MPEYMMIDLATLTIQKAHDAMKKGVFSAVDLAQAYLDAIKENDGDIHAYLEVYGDVWNRQNTRIKKFKDGSADSVDRHSDCRERQYSHQEGAS